MSQQQSHPNTFAAGAPGGPDSSPALQANFQTAESGQHQSPGVQLVGQASGLRADGRLMTLPELNERTRKVNGQIDNLESMAMQLTEQRPGMSDAVYMQKMQWIVAETQSRKEYLQKVARAAERSNSASPAVDSQNAAVPSETFEAGATGDSPALQANFQTAESGQHQSPGVLLVGQASRLPTGEGPRMTLLGLNDRARQVEAQIDNLESMAMQLTQQQRPGMCDASYREKMQLIARETQSRKEYLQKVTRARLVQDQIDNLESMAKQLTQQRHLTSDADYRQKMQFLVMETQSRKEYLEKIARAIAATQL